MDFIYLFRVLLKRKWIILASGILAAALAFFLTSNQEKQYRSSAQVATGFTATQQITVGEQTPAGYLESENQFNNAIVGITSQQVLSLVSYNLMLNDLSSPDPYHTLTEEDKQSEIYKVVKPAEAKKLLSEKLQNMTVLNSSRPEEKKLLEYLKLYDYDIKTLKKQDLRRHKLSRF